jgi:hypothetical protein
MGELRRIKPGLIDTRRGVNWWLVLVLVGLLLVWLVILIAVLRVMA